MRIGRRSPKAYAASVAAIVDTLVGVRPGGDSRARQACVEHVGLVTEPCRRCGWAVAAHPEDPYE